MFGLGGMEIALLLGIGILLFGKRLPDMGRSVGRAVTSFRQGLSGLEDDIDKASSRPAMPPPPERMPAPRFEGPAGDSSASV